MNVGIRGENGTFPLDKCRGPHNGVAIETAIAKTRMMNMATKIASAGKTAARPVELRGRDMTH